jgi:hypothetical protein
MSPVHTSPHNFCKTHFSIIVPFMLMSSKLFFAFTFSNHDFMYIDHPFLTNYMPAHLIFLHLTIPTLFGKELKLWSPYHEFSVVCMVSALNEIIF